VNPRRNDSYVTARLFIGGETSRKRIVSLSRCLVIAMAAAALLVLFIPVSVVKADAVVAFPDPNLEGKIREAIGKPTGDIYESDLLSLTTLTADGRGIVSLTGLGYCTNLTRLYLSNNQIVDVSPLASLTNMIEVLLSGNHISNVSPLASLTNLTHLSLVGNQLSDVSALATLENLTVLRLDDNQIANLSPLAGLTKLTELGLEDNQVSNLSPLSSLSSLTSLYLSANQISDLSPLSGLTSLSQLSLEYNQIENLAPLASIGSLTKILLDYNPVSNLAPLSGLANLWGLSLEYDEISDIQPLADNLGLASGDVVEVRGNPLNANSVNVCIPALEARGVLVRWDTVNQSPSQPSNVTPANEYLGASPAPTLISSAFSDPDTSDTHVCSQWQVTAVLGDYSSTVFDSGMDTTHLHEITLQPGVVTGNTTYYWRVRYQDNHGDWSTWSAERSFTTGDRPVVNSLNPDNGRRKQHLTVTITGASFYGATSVSFGSGITVEDFSVNSGTEITAYIVIDRDADIGERDVSVTTGWDTRTKAGGFAVVSGGGGVCSGGALATPGAPSEMTTVLAGLGLSFALAYLLLRKGTKGRRDNVRG
jgi:hypothetical protein